ncbi:MAG: dihydroneopterin aldolase [Muribaculaceae bacterium]|nr:dihydroneopterin aldolase [Muribaculaceae bacterium]
MAEIFRIKLIELRFFSKIGVFKQERKVGNTFIINISVDIDASSFHPEDLNSSISYSDLYEVVDAVMKKEWLLLETVAKEIKTKFLSQWPQIKGGKIEITKQDPPIAGINGSCGVEYIF